MDNCVREMTRQELVAENNKLRDEIECKCKVIDKYYRENNDYQCKMKEQQEHIECLQEELERSAETEENIIHCGSAITVAQDLIDKSVSGKDILGREWENYYYSKSELKQIAEHLMVYVNNSEDDR